MRISERQRQLLALLKTHVFCSVEHLAQSTYTSPSSIRRDLSYLQTQGLVRRTHGGASLAEDPAYVPALQNRMLRNVPEKRRIARLAAQLVEDGMSVLLDGSSTASFLLPHLAQHQRIQLFTNSMTTALQATELGIATHCLGGRCVRNGAVLAGEETCRAVSELYTDLFFFSSQCLDETGRITDSTQEENELRQAMLRQARTRVFLCDSAKFGKRTLYRLGHLRDLDAAVFDRPYPQLGDTGCCRLLFGEGED